MKNNHRSAIVEQVVAKAIQTEAPRTSLLCECCNQPVTVYKHQFTTARLYFLERLYRIAGRRPLHVPTSSDNVLGRRGSENLGTLSEWDLVEKSSGFKEGSRQRTVAGWWRVTLFGEAFLNGDVTIKEFVLVAPYFKFHSNQAEAIIDVPDVVKYLGSDIDVYSVPNGRFDPDKYIIKDEEAA